MEVLGHLEDDQSTEKNGFPMKTESKHMKTKSKFARRAQFRNVLALPGADFETAVDAIQPDPPRDDAELLDAYSRTVAAVAGSIALLYTCGS